MVLSPRSPGPAGAGLTIITSSKSGRRLMAGGPPNSSFDAARGHAIASAENVQLFACRIAGQQRHGFHEVHVGARLSTASLVRCIDDTAQPAELHEHVGNP